MYIGYVIKFTQNDLIPGILKKRQNKTLLTGETIGLSKFLFQKLFFIEFEKKKKVSCQNF